MVGLLDGWMVGLLDCWMVRWLDCWIVGWLDGWIVNGSFELKDGKIRAKNMRNLLILDSM